MRSLHDHGCEAHIAIDARHPLFEGHFPDRAVTPGVTMLQVIDTVCKQAKGADVRLAKINMAKFSQVWLPEELEGLDLTIEFYEADDVTRLKALLHREDSVYMQLKGELHGKA